jgi:hypothetical protein
MDFLPTELQVRRDRGLLVRRASNEIDCFEGSSEGGDNMMAGM